MSLEEVSAQVAAVLASAASIALIVYKALARPAKPSPTVSVSPSTVKAGKTFTCTWSGFEDGYAVHLVAVEGPPEWVGAFWYLGSTGSGSKVCATPAPGVYSLRAEQKATGLVSNTVTLTVTGK